MRIMIKAMTECAINISAVMLDGEISLCWYFARSGTGIYVITQSVQGMYQRHDSSSRISKAGSHDGGRHRVGMDVRG